MSSTPSVPVARRFHPGPETLRTLDRPILWVAVILILELIAADGYRFRAVRAVPISLGLSLLLMLLSLIRAGMGVLAHPRWRPILERYAPDVALSALALVPRIPVEAAGSLLAARHLLRLGNRALTLGRGRTWVLRVRRHPARVIALTFGVLILLGTLFLSFPGSSADHRPAAFSTALFTATSAICVTGLIVVDTATAWSPFGKAVLLVLMQIGGLGIMTLSATAVLALGRGFGAGSREFLEGMVEETAQRDVTRTLRFIVIFTFVTEIVGAALLTLLWWRSMPFSAALEYGAFHAVSAFCNAGFSTFSANLEGWSPDLGINLVVMALITVGGIGFPVAVCLRGLILRPHRAGPWWRTQEANTRLVLVTSGSLVLVGALLFFGLEFTRSLAGRGFGEKLLASLFQSVTTRTAGFNTVSMTAMAPATATFMLLWMFIGGSPGGTAGGVKTTTFGLLALALRSIIRQRSDVELFGRSVSRESVLRAIAAAFLGGSAVFLGFLLLLLTEHGLAYLPLLFEAVSAFGTVGLSLGATPELTLGGRLIIILLMFVGRTGPLTLAFALGRQAGRVNYRYPEAKILVG